MTIIGCDRFSKRCVKLYKEHLYVEKVGVCNDKKEAKTVLK